MTMLTSKWKRVGSGLVAGAAAALLIGTTVGSAVAATPTWTVKPGGAITGTAGKTTLIAKGPAGNIPLVCNSSATKAVLKKGSKLAGAGIGSITSVTFTKCNGLGLAFTVKTSATTKAPWKLNAVKYNKTTGVTTGTITGIKAILTGPSCKADVGGTTKTNTGTVAVTYSNKTHKLVVLSSGGTLHIWNVNGCLGVIKNGDVSQFSGTYLVKPTTTITSP